MSDYPIIVAISPVRGDGHVDTPLGYALAWAAGTEGRRLATYGRAKVAREYYLAFWAEKWGDKESLDEDGRWARTYAHLMALEDACATANGIAVTDCPACKVGAIYKGEPCNVCKK